jgi:hypothetical protein
MFCHDQIIAMLKEQERGLPTAEVCRKHGERGRMRVMLGRQGILMNLKKL